MRSLSITDIPKTRLSRPSDLLFFSSESLLLFLDSNRMTMTVTAVAVSITRAAATPPPTPAASDDWSLSDED